MSKKPLTIPNLIDEVKRLGGNVIATDNQYTILLSTLREDVDLVCGIKEDHNDYAIVELAADGDIDDVIYFLFNETIERQADGSVSGLSEVGITAMLHQVIPEGYHL